MALSLENVEIVLGTYENLLIGYKLIPSLARESPDLETSFTDDSHRGAIRCLTISSTGVLASSSTDDSIRLHSLKKRKEIGGLFEHNGTVNSMVFYDKNHMFSASEDGTICLWQSKNWELMRTLKGHRSHVMAVAVHPTGKLGLSVGSDRSFLTWDLLTGKLAFQRKLTEVAQNVFFTPSGDLYVLIYNRKMEVCALSDTKVVKEIPTEWRVNAVAHVEGNIFAVAGDDRNVLLVDVLKGTQVMTLDAAKPGGDEFRSRVRCICIIEQDGHKLLFLATASGDVKAFKLDLLKTEAEELFFGEARVRVTAMGIYNCSNRANISVKPKNGNAVPKSVREENVPENDDASDEDDEVEGNSDDENKESDQEEAASPPKAKERKADQISTAQIKKTKKKAKKRNLDNSSEGEVLLKSKKRKDKTQTSKELKTSKKVKRKSK